MPMFEDLLSSMIKMINFYIDLTSIYKNPKGFLFWRDWQADLIFQKWI
jgi:hypothetical protein